ncbi:MAG: M14 family metallopeptidase [Thermoplasmatota archaeon]
MMRASAAFAVALFLLPGASAEFGVESERGYPIGVDGEITPFVYQHWIDKNPEVSRLVAQAQADPINKLAGLTVYPYYPILVAELQRLATDYPDLARLHSAGKSHAGLDLYYLEIADFGNPDRVPIDSREVVYLDGGTHSNEYSGVYFVTEWAQFLLDEFETNETARWIVENRHTFILPMVNPDGSHAFGRINAITVNVNRNFPATWGTVDELPGVNWPGPYPASEPETQAVINLLSNIDADYVNSIHCCGNLWLHPFGAEHLGKPVDDQMFTQICDVVFADVRSDCGQIWSTIYPASGTTADEGYGLLGASSWSYEMSGRGAYSLWGQPVITGDPREQEIESWRGVMHAFLHVEKYGAHPVVTAIEGTGSRLEVTVHNQGYGNLTQGALTVAGQAVSFGELPAGDVRTYTVEGDFAAGDIPVELEWKKREHPEAKWGRTLATSTLSKAGDRLTGTIDLPAAAPSMADLLPEQRSEEEPALLDAGDADEGEDSPGLGLMAALVGLAGMAALRRRQRS